MERAREIHQSLTTLGLRIAFRSKIETPSREPIDCLLLDTTGELRFWFAVATVVFMGKSLTTIGGQNPVEPILAHKPVVFGPHMENFAALSRALLARKAAIQVDDASSLVAAITQLLRDPEARSQIVARAHEVLAPHEGATRRTAELVLAAKSLAR